MMLLNNYYVGAKTHMTHTIVREVYGKTGEGAEDNE